jgi:hypothetical protein
MTTTTQPELAQKRDRRTAEEVRYDHYREVLKSLAFEEKVALIISLRDEVNSEIAHRTKVAAEATELAKTL